MAGCEGRDSHLVHAGTAGTGALPCGASGGTPVPVLPEAALSFSASRSPGRGPEDPGSPGPQPAPGLHVRVCGHTFRPTGSALYFCFWEDYRHGDGQVTRTGGGRNPPAFSP